MSAPLPIIVCGSASPAVIAATKPLYMPEYEVIHNVTSPAGGALEIPFVLRAEAPPEGENHNLGTHNYSKPAAAIFAGAAYDDAGFQQMREACKGVSKVPWLRPDMSVPRPPLGPGYAEHIVGRIKKCMRKIREEGRMGEDGVYFY
ncbi:hypothetical protein DL98DRAFT_473884 [Cadophora sp. DSE1049]|nr:hypothetical protein DL98DRAFT_473884 [Cadophora sp. DSE1049]